MNKKTILMTMMILIVLVLSSVTIESEGEPIGCCFLTSDEVCIDVPALDPTYYLIPDEETCIGTGFQGMFYDNTCAELDLCDAACCCEDDGESIYTIEGICEDYDLTPYKIDDNGRCTAFCASDTPPCNENCEINEQDCEGRTSTITASPDNPIYYCWENDISYDTRDACNDVNNDGCISKEIDPCVYPGAITDQCNCGGYIDNSGYCCWSNTWADTPDNCPPGNLCETEQYAPGDNFYKCCDACLDYNLDWDDGGACEDDIIHYGPNQPQCCQDCADPNPLPPDQCCENDWQCDGYDYGGTILSEPPYNYIFATCRDTPCDQPCAEPECPDGRLDGPISSLDGPPKCWCGDAVINTDTSSDNKYCCYDEIAETYSVRRNSCDKQYYSLSGLIYDSRNPPGGVDGYAQVSAAAIVIEDGVETVYAILSDNDGSYTITDLEVGTGYTISITHDDYYSIRRLSFNYDDDQVVDYPLDPTIADDCNNFENPPPPTADTFAVEHIKGVKAVNLRWDSPSCADMTQVDSYEIEVLSNSITIASVTIPHPVYVANYIIDGFPYEDVEWQTEYTFTIKVHYGEGGGRVSAPTSDTIITGNAYCEGVYAEEELCLNSPFLDKTEPLTLKHKCNGENEPYSIEDCTRFNTANNNYICVGPDTDGSTTCKEIDICSATAENPFGLFFTGWAFTDGLQDCEDNGDNYCYYDYSNTIVDSCYSCQELYTSESPSCQEYRSEAACSTDNCGLAGEYSVGEVNNDCQWIPSTTYSELGKGICYDEDYNGTEYCGLCDAKSVNIFSEIDCSQSLCTQLGRCYQEALPSSNLGHYSCLPCTEDITCEDLKTEAACVNADETGDSVNVEIDLTCPDSITKSKDACGFALCSWGTPIAEEPARCFKDGDGDGQPDCLRGEGIKAKTCRKDFEPAETEPLGEIPVLNMDGTDITFKTINDNKLKEFKFCLNKNDVADCCPDINVDILSTDKLSVTFNPIELAPSGSIDGSGDYYLRYFTKDIHNNTEIVKSETVSIDVDYPELSFNYDTIKGDDGNNYTTFRVSPKEGSTAEIIDCTYTSTDMDAELIDNAEAEKVLDSDTFGTVGYSFKVKFKNLRDNNYRFTTTCIDVAGNVMINETDVVVDLIHSTFDLYPDGIAIQTPSTEFRLKTFDDSTCVLSFLESGTLESGTQPYSFLATDTTITMKQSEFFDDGQGGYYQHITVDSTENPIEIFAMDRSKSASYRVKATCTSTNGAVDHDYYHFTVDQLKPETITDFDFTSGHKFENGKVEVVLQCRDQPIDGTPYEAGCEDNDIYICGRISCTDFTQRNSIEFDSEGLHRISYYSVDNVGNQEAVHTNMRVVVDNFAPDYLTIDEPDTSEQNIVTHNPWQTIKGRAEDNNDIASVEIVIKDENDNEITRELATLEYETGADNIANYELIPDDYSGLSDGMNYISVTAKDSAGNSITVETEIYLDIAAPDISAIKISDNYVDDNNYPDPDEDWDRKKVEYGYSLKFEATVENDVSGVAEVNITIKCISQSCADYSDEEFTLNELEDDKWEIVLPPEITLLAVGDYEVKFIPMDDYGTRPMVGDEETAYISVVDTIQPVIDWIYPDEADWVDSDGNVKLDGTVMTVYQSEIEFEGSAALEPRIAVTFRVSSEVNDEVVTKEYTEVGGDVSRYLGTLEIYDPLGPEEGLPEENSLYFYVLGDVTQFDIVNNYLEFSIYEDGQTEKIPYFIIPRHKITNIEDGDCFAEACIKITLDKEVGRNVKHAPDNGDGDSSGSATIYSTEKPTGRFNQTIPLEIGDNIIFAQAVDGSNQESPVYKFNIIRYFIIIDELPELIITSPQDGDVFNGDTITIEGTSNITATVRAINTFSRETLSEYTIAPPTYDEDLDIFNAKFEGLEEVTISTNTISRLNIINTDGLEYTIVNRATVETYNLAIGGSIELSFSEPGEYIYDLKLVDGTVTSTLTVTIEEVDVSFSLTVPLSNEDMNPITVNASNIIGSTSQNLVFYKDTTSPEITIIQPLDGATIIDPTPTIEADILDDYGIDESSIVLTIDGTIVDENDGDYDVTPTKVMFTPTLDLDEGQHTVLLKANDTGGNQAVTGWTFTVDTSPPAEPIWMLCGESERVIEDYAIIGGEDVCIEAMFDEQITLLASYPDDFISTDELTNKTFRYNDEAVFTQGSNTLILSIADVAGNPITYERNIVFDSTSPIINLNVQPPDSPTNKRSVILSGTVIEDNLKSLKVNGQGIEVKLDNSYGEEYSLKEGTTTFTIIATDQVGLTATETIAIESDQSPPVFSGVDTTTEDGYVKIDFTVSEELKDNPNNPLIEIVDLGTASLGEKDGLAYSYILPLDEEDYSGTYQITMSAEDLVGNIGYDDIYDVYVDTIAPTFSNNYPYDGHTNNGINQDIYVHIKDDGSGINEDSIIMTIDGEEVQPGYDGSKVSHSMESMDIGTHDVIVGVEDNAGNSNSITWSFEVFRPEDCEGCIVLEDPTITINGDPADYPNYIETTSVNIQIEYDKNVYVDDVKLDGTSYIAGLEIVDGIYTLTFDANTGNTYLFEINAHDDDGFVNNAGAWFIVDTELPTIDITAPEDGKSIGTEIITLKGTFTEDNLDSIRITGDIWAGETYLDKEINQVTKTFEVELLLTEGDGSKTINAIIKDKFGNEIEDSIIITLDTTGPSLTFNIEPLPKPYAGYDGITDSSINILGASEESSLVELFINKVSKRTYPIEAGTPLELKPFTFYDVKLMASNPNEVLVESTNSRGISSKMAMYIIYDNMGPDILNPKPKDTTVVDLRPEISALFSDYGGIKSVTLKIDDNTVDERDGSYIVTPTKVTFTPDLDLPDGQQNIELTAYDMAGNKGVEVWSFNIDQNAPDFDGFYLCDGRPIPDYIDDMFPCFLAKFNESVNILQPEYFEPLIGSDTIFKYQVSDEKKEGKIYDLLINAEDMAGNRAIYTTHYMINITSLDVIIYDIDIEGFVSGYVTEGNPLIQLKTHKEAVCSISSDPDIYIDGVNVNDEEVNLVSTQSGSTYLHSATLGSLDGALIDRTDYTLSIRCLPTSDVLFQGSMETKFTTWYNGPIPIIIDIK